jgi:hypothetical protein
LLLGLPHALTQKYKYTMPYACGAVDAFVTNKRIERTAEHESRALVSSVHDLYLDFKQAVPAYAFISSPLFVRLCEYLQQTGSLLLLPGNWVVLDPNIVTKHIFGQLFRQPIRLKMGESEHMLTAADIEHITAGRYWFHNEEVVPMLMQEFDLCIPFPTSAIDPVVRYFPCFTQQQLLNPAEELSILCGRPNLGVRIRFEDPHCLSYGLDFTARLFMELYLALTPPSNPNSMPPQMWSNAALLKTRITVQPTIGCEADESGVFHKWVLVERHPPSSPGFDIVCVCDPFDVSRVGELLSRATRIIENYIGIPCQVSHLSPNPELLDIAHREALDAAKLEEIQQSDAALYHYLTTGAGSAPPPDPRIREVLENLYDTRAQLSTSFEQLKHMEAKFNDLQTGFQFPEEYYPVPNPIRKDMSHGSDILPIKAESKEAEEVEEDEEDDDFDVIDPGEVPIAANNTATSTNPNNNNDDNDDDTDSFFDNQSDYDGRTLDDDPVEMQQQQQHQQQQRPPAFEPEVPPPQNPASFLDQAEGDIP